MTTIAELVNEIDRELLSTYTAPMYDTPAASFVTAATTIQLATVEQVSRGATLDCGFELMYVTNWEEGTRTATVIRGFLGTTARSGATTDLVRVNPRVSSAAIVDAIRDELRSWDERVYSVQVESLSFTSSQTSALATPTRPPYRIVSARPRPSAADDLRTWTTLDLRRSEATGEFSTGYSVQLPAGMVFGTATTVDVVYALPFATGTLTTTTDLQTTVGLADTQLEILKWGVLWRVMGGKQEARLDPFGTIRTDIEQSVPAMSPLQAAAQYKRMRDDAYDVEVRRLLGRYPYRTAA